MGEVVYLCVYFYTYLHLNIHYDLYIYSFYIPITFLNDERFYFNFFFQTCSEKISVLRRDYFQIVQLSENYQWSGCKRYNSSGYVYLHCQGTRNFRSFRPRWWFITVGRCKPENNNVSFFLSHCTPWCQHF